MLERDAHLRQIRAKEDPYLSDEKDEPLTMYVSIGLEPCLYIYTATGWERLTSKLDSYVGDESPWGKENARDVERKF